MVGLGSGSGEEPGWTETGGRERWREASTSLRRGNTLLTGVWRKRPSFLLGPHERGPRWPRGLQGPRAHLDEEPGPFPFRRTLLGSASPARSMVRGPPMPPQPFDAVCHTLPDVNAPSVRVWRGGEPQPFPGAVPETCPLLSGHWPGLPPSRPASCGRVRHRRREASWEL